MITYATFVYHVCCNQESHLDHNYVLLPQMEGAEAERAKVAADSFVADHSALLVQFYTSLAQVQN